MTVKEKTNLQMYNYHYYNMQQNYVCRNSHVSLLPTPGPPSFGLSLHTMKHNERIIILLELLSTYRQFIHFPQSFSLRQDMHSIHLFNLLKGPLVLMVVWLLKPFFSKGEAKRGETGESGESVSIGCSFSIASISSPDFFFSVSKSSDVKPPILAPINEERGRDDNSLKFHYIKIIVKIINKQNIIFFPIIILFLLTIQAQCICTILIIS